MSIEPAATADPSMAKKLRDDMQAAQDHYEYLLTKVDAEDGDKLTAAEEAISRAHAAYDDYLISLP